MADNIEPVTRLEKIIAGEDIEPVTRLEKIIALYGTGGSGGTGGTTNYNDLLNKPSINGVKLSGNKSLSDLGIINYDDTAIKSDITDLQTDKQDKTDNTLDTTDKTVVGAINEINGNALDNVGFSSDYKNIIINRKSGLNPYTIPISSIIHNAKITELNDVDSTNIGDGKTLVYDSATQKHKYVDSTGTDELVKMDNTSTAKYLEDLIDKTTIVNDNGKLVAKTLDGLTTSITELNYIKGLQMPVQDLVTAFANGGLKTIDTPFPTYADLQSYDVSVLLDDIRYLVRVLADETHGGKITAYLIKKGQTAPTFYGYLSDSRNFTINPIDLVNEITGKLKAKNIDVDDLFALLTLNDTYKTATVKDEIFGTHGAKAMYDELVADIGNKANTTDLDTHINDTIAHMTQSEKDSYVKKTDITDTIDSTSTSTDIASAKGVYDYIGTLNSLTGDIEYGNFKLVGNYTITSPTETSVKELIPFTDLLNSEGNMVSNNGLIALKKGKTYKITSAIRTNDVSSTDNGFIEFCLYDNKGNLLKQGIYNSGIVYRGNYPINYTITPSEDISVGIYITYRTAPIKIIVGENRSYLNITEIPNPTSIMNVTDEHIKEVATTNLSKLQFAPFSDGWQMEIKHEQVGETDYVIIDSFKDNEILRYVLRQKTQTKEQSIAMLYSDDGGTTFKNANNVCTTKVFDIALTKLTIKDSYSTGNVYYQVKNGECTISGQQFRRTTATGAVNNVILIEGLPKCSTTVPSAPILCFGEVKGQVWMSSNSTDLKIAVPTSVGDTGENCVFTIKYPVSES